ncbi:MAG: HAD family hydrolase [Bacilli bacterium]|nr:HAD family hydrolase [Bacilli bacterium]
MNNNIKLLVFDFDGTLANTVPHIVNCVLKCIEKFNLKKLTKEDVQKYNGAVLADAMKHLGATDEQLPEIKKYYADIFLEDMSDISMYDGVKETLLKLKQDGYILTLASNRGRNTVEPLLKYLDIDTIFTRVICENDVENKKPSPDMVEIIMEEKGCNKNETLVIGDTKFDILMGKSAGCITCLISYDETIDSSILELKPDLIINNFRDLLK